MSNVKNIQIIGDVPFNTVDYPEMNNLLGQLNSPVFGLKIQYISETRREKNEHGGKIVFYGFTLTGREAVSIEWIKLFLRTVKSIGGKVFSAVVCDVENNFFLNDEFKVFLG